MTTANKITIFRVICIPVFIVLMYMDGAAARYGALAVFVIASLSDFLDGYIARHYNQVYNFGKFMDPLADKILVITAMLLFVESGRMPGWVLRWWWPGSSPCPACGWWLWNRGGSLPPPSPARSRPPAPWSVSS